jgi:hypothetical protein
MRRRVEGGGREGGRERGREGGTYLVFRGNRKLAHALSDELEGGLLVLTEGGLEGLLPPFLVLPRRGLFFDEGVGEDGLCV